MSHFYKYLEREGYCRNLTASLVKPKKESNSIKETQEILVWEDQELKKILENLGGESQKRFRLLLILAACTGCRIGELLGLKYSDIRDGKVFIERSLGFEVEITRSEKKPKKLVIGPVKTLNAIRSIPLLKNTLAEIEKHRAWHNKEMVANGYRTEFIFTTQSGSFYDRNNLNRACERYYKTIGIEYKGFHVYRHTFCTNLCKNGVPLQTAYKLMGHEDIRVTARFYTNIDDEQKQEAIEKLMSGINI